MMERYTNDTWMGWGRIGWVSLVLSSKTSTSNTGSSRRSSSSSYMASCHCISGWMATHYSTPASCICCTAYTSCTIDHTATRSGCSWAGVSARARCGVRGPNKIFPSFSWWQTSTCAWCRNRTRWGWVLLKWCSRDLMLLTCSRRLVPHNWLDFTFAQTLKEKKV